MGKLTGASLNVSQCRNEKGRFRGFLKHSQKDSFASSESICTKEEAVNYNLEKSISIDDEYKDDFGRLNDCQFTAFNCALSFKMFWEVQSFPSPTTLPVAKEILTLSQTGEY